MSSFALDNRNPKTNKEGTKMEKANVTYQPNETELSNHLQGETALYQFGYVMTAIGSLPLMACLGGLMFILAVMIDSPTGEWVPGDVYAQHLALKIFFWMGFVPMISGLIALAVDTVKIKRWNRWQWFLKLRA